MAKTSMVWDQGAWWVLLAANYIIYRVDLDGSGPGGIRIRVPTGSRVP